MKDLNLGTVSLRTEHHAYPLNSYSAFSKSTIMIVSELVLGLISQHVFRVTNHRVPIQPLQHTSTFVSRYQLVQIITKVVMKVSHLNI